MFSNHSFLIVKETFHLSKQTTNKTNSHLILLLRQSKVQIMTSNSLVDAQHIISHSLEMTISQQICQYLPSSIVRSGDEALVLNTISNRLKGIRNIIKTLQNITENINSRSQFSLRILSFHGSRSNSYINTLSTDSMIKGDTRNVNI